MTIRMPSRKRSRTRQRSIRNQEGIPASSGQGASTDSTSPMQSPLSRSLDENLEGLKSILGRSSDVQFREFRIVDGRRACLIYVDGLSDSKIIDEYILSPLTKQHYALSESAIHLSLDDLQYNFLPMPEVTRVTALSEVIEKVVVNMQVALLIEEEVQAFTLNAGGGEDRSIEEPSTEAVIRGPREGFNESLKTSLSLVRRRIRTPDLVVQSSSIGTYTKTKVAVCYIDGIIDESLVGELEQRLSRIETDGIIDSGYIEEFIEDDPYSPFPQIQNTERPDVVAALLLEGRLAILVDGSPFALIAPINLWGALQAAEDYYERFPITNLLRWLRYLFLFIALYLPSLYVAITTFHHEMLPTKLLISIAAAREVTPFPAVVECLLMEVTFEALREAGIRLPKTIGSAISIVGALVIGQAAVEAGIVSAPMVIVVSITGIASFVIPRFNFAISIRMLRFIMIFLGGTLGLFGIVIGSIAIVIHVAGLRSLGVPYLQPVAPLEWKNMRDVFVRAPHWALRQRPTQTSKVNVHRTTESTNPPHRVPPEQQKT